MKKYLYRFRSIMVNNIEKNVPGTGRLTLELDMDENTVEKHELELTFTEIIQDRAWKINFLLSFMIVGGISGMIFGIVYITSIRASGGTGLPGFTGIFIGISSIIMILLWIALSLKNSVATKKREYVEKTRGKGNWRIVDESEWDNFYRLLTISKNRKQS